jgi:HK97 family phage portal protein
MPHWLNRLRAAFARPKAETPAERKQAACGFFELHTLLAPEWSAANAAAFAREGFAANPVAYRCVMMIARAVAAVPLKAAGRGREKDEAARSVLALLRRPNALQSGRELIEAFIAHTLIAGNGYLRATLLDGAPVELHALDPKRVEIVTDHAGWPVAWDYAVAGRRIRLKQGPDDAIAPVMHLRLFSPFSDIEGLSPFAACARAVDIHNAAAAWSKALLDNAARPSGALIYRGEGGGLSPEQFARLKRELETAYSGARNAGRPLVLEGGLEWMPLSHSPKDMEHIEMRHAAAREIALAFGVPPMLLGIPGDNTYSNFAEANRAFWRQTVLPLARRLADHLGIWLAPAFGVDDLALEPDVDALEATAPEREAHWRRMRESDFLTINEKREALGYPPLPEGDAIPPR